MEQELPVIDVILCGPFSFATTGTECVETLSLVASEPWREWDWDNPEGKPFFQFSEKIVSGLPDNLL